jgi:LacI family transcriptional regulator
MLLAHFKGVPLPTAAEVLPTHLVVRDSTRSRT